MVLRTLMYICIEWYPFPLLTYILNSNMPHFVHMCLMACSAKQYDNFLVETDIFCHFKGLILCNAKRLQFHRNKKNKNIGAHFIKSYIPLCRFFLTDGVIGSVIAIKKLSSLRRLRCHF